MGAVFSYFQSLFWQQELEIALVGMMNAGKSSLVRVINTGKFEDDMIPTIGFQMHKVTKGKVTIKIWDLGGQKKFRGMWERYCRGVEVIVFVVDAADPKNFDNSRNELDALLKKQTLAKIPLLVLLNKNDHKAAVAPEVAVEALQLKSIMDREVSYFSVSCKNIVNIDKTLEWIIKHSKSKK